MTALKYTPKHAAQLSLEEEQRRTAKAIRRFDDFKTLLFAMVVCTPIATVVGMLIQDWFMIGLAIFISSACGITALYLLRRLEETVFKKL